MYPHRNGAYPDPRRMTNEEWLSFRDVLGRRAEAERIHVQRAMWGRIVSRFRRVIGAAMWAPSRRERSPG